MSAIFEDVLDRYKPALPVTARQLAEMIVSIIQGGLMLVVPTTTSA